MKKVILLLLMSTIVSMGYSQSRRLVAKKAPTSRTSVTKKPVVNTKALTDSLNKIKAQIKEKQKQLMVYEMPLTQQLKDGTTFRFVDCWQEGSFVNVKFEVCNNLTDTRLKINGPDWIGLIDDNQASHSCIKRGEYTINDQSRIDFKQGVVENLTFSFYLRDNILSKVVNLIKIYEENSDSKVEFREIPIREAKGDVATKVGVNTLQDSIPLMKSYLKSLNKRLEIKPIQIQKFGDDTFFELLECRYNGKESVSVKIRIINHDDSLTLNFNGWGGLFAHRVIIDNEKKSGYLYVGHSSSQFHIVKIEENVYSNIYIHSIYVGDKIPKMMNELELKEQNSKKSIVFLNIPIER